MKPKTSYTKSGDFNIAYQVVGDGPVDIIYIPGWVSNIDMMWAEPRLAAFLTRLSIFARLILFDKTPLPKIDHLLYQPFEPDTSHNKPFQVHKKQSHLYYLKEQILISL